MVQEYRSNRNVFCACHYHVVWCPKYRRKLLVGRIETRLNQIISQVCQEHQQEVPELKSKLPTLWTNSYFVSTTGGAP